MKLFNRKFTHFHIQHILTFITHFHIHHIFLVLLTFSFNYSYAQDMVQKIIPGRVNSIKQQKKPYVILISADGFRYDLADKYNAVNLLRLRSKGIAAK